MSEPSKAATKAAKTIIDCVWPGDEEFIKAAAKVIQDAINSAISEQAATIAELEREAAYWKQDSEKHAQGLMEQAATIERLEKDIARLDWIEGSST